MRELRTLAYGWLATAVLVLASAAPCASLPGQQGNSAAETSNKQESPAAKPATEKPVVRTVTRLVQVTLVAHDKHGQPVTDLKREELRLFDKGAEQ